MRLDFQKERLYVIVRCSLGVSSDLFQGSGAQRPALFEGTKNDSEAIDETEGLKAALDSYTLNVRDYLSECLDLFETKALISKISNIFG
jgi:hypothetical protein